MQSTQTRRGLFKQFTCLLILAVLVSTGCSGCVKPVEETGTNGDTPPGTDGGGKVEILIDGSSTVFPISQAMAEEYMETHDNVDIKVGTSGTGGGFKKFCIGETVINDASRPIKDKEIELCKENGIEYIELKVAIDGLSVMVNPDNDWCECLTVAELKKIFGPDSKVKTWKDVRSEWPDQELKLFGPDSESGTFDYFTEEVCGKSGAIRSDQYTPNTDDNYLVTGIAGEKNALGFFGYAYYAENKDKLKILGVDGGDGCVTPTPDTIESGAYSPLSRPLFIYVNKAKLNIPEVKRFLDYYMGEGQKYVSEVGYIPLTDEVLSSQKAKLSGE